MRVRSYTEELIIQTLEYTTATATTTNKETFEEVSVLQDNQVGLIW